MNKMCRICKGIYPATNEFFYKDNSRADKLCPECKMCRKVSFKRYQTDTGKNWKRVKYWRKANANAFASQHRKDVSNRKATKLGAEGHHSPHDVILLLRHQNGQCAYCGCDIEASYTVDHVIPLSRSGTEYANNLLLACLSCNSSKGNKLLSEWVG